ncbi:MAG: lyase family protein, partial [Sedimenticolaceae bacterium]
MSAGHRVEHDSMGDVLVPSAAMYGAQTQRAVDNFRISGFGMPPHFIHGLAMIKRAAADVNCELGLLDRHIAQAIGDAAREVEQGRHDKQFPVDVFQTGSGTSSNMNVNEVIAHLASERAGCSVHPNDHVNMGQSSNDVIPTAIHLSACIALQNRLLPALAHLQAVIEHRADDCRGVVKTGRTHLMDALPLRLDQELGAWASQVADG